MATYPELVSRYKRRQEAAGLMDSLASGLSLADDLGQELGVLAESPLMEAVSLGLPLSLIAVSEGGKAITGRKTGTAALQDAGYRLVRTGAAMGVGAAIVSLGGGALPAIPLTAATRLLLDRFRSRRLTLGRVAQRTQRLRALRERRLDSRVRAEALPE